MTPAPKAAAAGHSRRPAPQPAAAGLPAVLLANVLVALLASALTGCGTPAVPPAAAPAPAPPPRAAPPVDPWARPLADFERRQRATAEAAAAQGRWAESIAAWDVLTALHPEDNALANRRAQARAQADAAAAERLQRARQAQQRGDTEAAARAWLEVLALQPGQPEASEALRAMERERVRRQHLGKLSRYALTGGAAATATPPTAPSAQQNEIEHASLLAEQGEIDSAVALLKPLADKSGADSPARRLLAEIHFRHAETLLPGNRAAAIAALERCLRLQPHHAGALALMKTARAEAAAAGKP